MPHYVLESPAQELADATAKPPFIYELTPQQARTAFDDLQATGVDKVAVAEDKWITVLAEVGDVRVRILKPDRFSGAPPVILYLHGGGWILGDSGTHDRLIRELADGVHAAVVFVEYDRAPQARYPVALEQGYATAQWITRHGTTEGLDPSRIAVAGDSAGGNMSTALAIMAKQRGDVRFVHQSLYYPVTDAAQDSGSYHEFADGPYLTANTMAWFWDAYIPASAADAEGKRREITASPLRAELAELRDLPPAFVIVAQHDVLRDEGEDYASRLTQACVPTTSVRYNGTVHDFMMLNSLRSTRAASAAIEQAVHVLRNALGTA